MTALLPAPARDLDLLAAEIKREIGLGDAALVRGLLHYRRAGVRLAEARQAIPHGGWLPWLETHGIPRTTAWRYEQLAGLDEAECSTLEHLRDALEVLADRRREAKGPPAAPEMAFFEEVRPTTWVEKNSGCEEWYTPAVYVEAAREVMGCIDLDPASSEVAQRTVQAMTFYTKELDGLSLDWAGNVYCNPPYSRVIDRFVDKLVAHYLAGEVEQAVVLTNNATDTQWFQRLAASASAICFPAGRVKFLDPDGVEGAPLQGQAVTYLGDRQEAFAKRFAGFGLVLSNRHRP
jgi:hypothetical protein